MANTKADPAIEFVSFACILILWISGVFSICWLWSFYILRNQREIAVRDVPTAILKGILCITGIMIGYPIIFYFFTIPDVPKPSVQIGEIISNFIVLITTIGPYHIFTYRAYMVYFDINWHSALLDTKWRLYIDPNETNWFILNRNTWGNRKRIGCILFGHLLFWMVMIESICIYNNYDRKIVRIMVGASSLLPTICDIIVYAKFPKLADLLSISDQIKLILRIEIIVLILFYIFGIVLKAQHYEYKFIVMLMTPAIMLFMFNIFSFYYPLKKYNYPCTPWRANKHRKMECVTRSVATTPSSQRTIKKQLSITIESRLGIRDVLKDKNGFNEFARHLTKEWCIENLLFLVETQQWISTYKKYEDPLSLNFSDKAPKSQIAMKITNENELEFAEEMPSDKQYIQSVEIFKKYIINDSHFCINISYKMRNSIYDKFGFNDDKELNIEETVQFLKQSIKSKEELFHIFDNARRDIFKLIGASFSRFKTTDEYDTIYTALDISSEEIDVDHDMIM